MKFKKLLSLALSGTMAISIFGSLSVNAEGTKKYKLSELLAMSKEEFFSLDEVFYTPEDTYNYYERKHHYTLYHPEDAMWEDECKLSFDVRTFTITTKQPPNLKDSRQYNPGITEKELDELLDVELFDGVKFCITSSPVMTDEETLNDPYLFLKDRIIIGVPEFPIPGYGFKYLYDDNNISDEEIILKYAKLNYCIDQVRISSYCCGLTYGSNSQVAYGDANGDGVINIRDAAHIAIKLACGKANELTELADANGDEKINIRDGAFIARLMAARKVYKTN